MNGVAALLDGRIRHRLIEPLLRIVKSKAGRAHFAVHVHFAVGTPRDAHVARSIRKLQADRTTDIKAAVEIAACCRSCTATRQRSQSKNSGEEQQEISGLAVACHPSSTKTQSATRMFHQ